jgi:hypothetical protein
MSIQNVNLRIRDRPPYRDRTFAVFFRENPESAIDSRFRRAIKIHEYCGWKMGAELLNTICGKSLASAKDTAKRMTRGELRHIQEHKKKTGDKLDNLSPLSTNHLN